MCEKIQTELILLYALVMQITYVLEDEGCLHKAVLHVLSLDMKLMSLKNSMSFASVFPQSTSNCDPGFAHPLN